jgi:hypothetical protein
VCVSRTSANEFRALGKRERCLTVARCLEKHEANPIGLEELGRISGARPDQGSHKTGKVLIARSDLSPTRPEET